MSRKTDHKIGTFGSLNPIRYRGCCYDSERNMYYLQSRYYDPVMKRMIAADDESLTSGAAIHNKNLFAYCDNAPVNRAAVEGMRRVGAGIKTCGKMIKKSILKAYNGIKQTRADRWKSNIKATCVNIHINFHKWLIKRFRRR